MTHTAWFSHVLSFGGLGVATLARLRLVAAAISAEAGQRRARLSRDLSERLAARVDASQPT